MNVSPAPSRGRVPDADDYAAGSLGVGLLVARVGAAEALLGAAVFARGDESSAALAVVTGERAGVAAAELAFDVDAVTAFIRSPLVCFRVAAERTAICGAPAAACATVGLAGTTFAGVAAGGVDSFASTAAGSLADVDSFAAG